MRHTFRISKHHLYSFYIFLKNCLVGSSHQKTNVGSISSFPEYKWRQFVQFICLFLNPEVSPHSSAHWWRGNFLGCSKLGVFINCFYVAAPMEIKIQPKGFVLFFQNKNYSFSFNQGRAEPLRFFLSRV